MLKRKTPLRAKTPLKTKTPLQSRNPLKAKSDLRLHYAEKLKAGEVKKKTKKPYKPSVPYWSILTEDLDECYITGSKDNVHIHHIFGAANKKNSEKYGFIIPLRADWHNMSDYGVHFNKELNLKLKRKCEDYWLKHYGNKEDFIQKFGMWW